MFIGDGGVIKTVLRQGDGCEMPDNVYATVHYVGTLSDGTVFDSSRKRAQPFSFNVGKREGKISFFFVHDLISFKVILGWDKGVKTMTKGEICKLECSPDYGNHIICICYWILFLI